MMRQGGSQPSEGGSPSDEGRESRNDGISISRKNREGNYRSHQENEDVSVLTSEKRGSREGY